MVTMQMLILLIPQGYAAESSLRAMDTTAGTPAMIMLTGEPNEIVPIAVTNPFNATVEQSFKLNEEGSLQYWYKQSVVAGEYTVTTPDHQTSFVVTAGMPDLNRSDIEFNDYTTYVGKALQGSLTLKDAYGNVIVGRKITIEADNSTVINCLRSCRTDGDGRLSFSVNTQQAGLKTLIITDAENQFTIAKEDIGFIPQVQSQAPQMSPYSYNPYMMGYSPWNAVLNPYQTALPNTFTTPTNTYGPYTDISSSFQYLPQQFPASINAQGNDDTYFLGSTAPQTQNFLGANLLEGIELLAQVEGSTSSSSSSSTVAQASGQVNSFEIIIGNDAEADFEEAVVVSAQSALDLIVKAIDTQGEVVENYTGEIAFELSSGGQVPTDYEFSPIDKGVALFELALVLPSGDFTLSVTDVNKPSVTGEIEITSQFQGTPNLNNTDIQLTINSPIANSVYAKNFSVQGFTNTDNTEIVIKEGALELERGEVDQNKNFNFVLDLADGNHTLEFLAIYKPDGSEVTATVPIEVDKTAPVIQQVNLPTEPVRAGESFTVSATAEERSTMQIFINNRSFDFTEKRPGEFELTANAPLDTGNFPVHARATDELGNVTESPEVGTLTVIPGLQEISNLLGIPGIESATLSWTAVPGAVSYDVSYRSIIGQNQQDLTTTEPRISVRDLAPNLSYVFTVVAVGADGEEVSKPTESKSIKVLEEPVRNAAVEVPEPTVTEPVVVEEPKQAAEEVQTAPVRHTKSGPEVYLLIIASLIILNIYGKARKAVVDRA